MFGRGDRTEKASLLESELGVPANDANSNSNRAGQLAGRGDWEWYGHGGDSSNV